MKTGSYTLRPYQQKIVDDLKVLPSCALYMGTGTGKTLTSLDITKYHPTSKLLVVCPHSAIKQWKINVNKFFPEYEVVSFLKRATSKDLDYFFKTAILPKRAVVIINYEMIYRVPWLLHIVNDSWTIIADELHRAKNMGNRRKPVKATHALLRLGDKTPYKIGLTATPTQGKFGGYIDYYAQLTFLGYLNMSYKDFFEKFVIYKEVTYPTTPFPIKEITGYKNIGDIDEVLKVIARRYTTRYDDFEPQFIKIMIDRPKSYNKLVREKAYKKDGKVIFLSNSARSRIAKKTITTGTVLGYDMESNQHALKDNTNKIDWLKDFLQDTDEVVSIFYTYNVELHSLEELCKELGKKYIVINGKTKDKYSLINDGGYEVVLGQFQAMSEALDGLHLHCHIEVFFSMPESSLHYTQAIGRIDRIGQTKVPMYYFLIMEHTLDEIIMSNIENKIEFSEKTLEKLEVEGVY